MRQYARLTSNGGFVAQLVHCQHCKRHFKRIETACPFCGTSADQATVKVAYAPAGASRSRVFAARASLFVSAVFVACTDGSGQSAHTSGGTPTTDAPNGSVDATSSADESEHTNATGVTSGPHSADVDGQSSAEGNGQSSTDATADVSATTDSPTPGSACPGFPETPHPTAHGVCDTSADCASGEQCSPTPVYITNDHVPNCVADPCVCNPSLRCDATTCDGVCVPDGTACGGYCSPDCTPENCTGTNECVDNRCVSKPCDADGGPVCGDGYRCEPGNENGGTVGCVQIPCDEDGALACPSSYKCDPSNALPNANGCVVKQCDEPDALECPQHWDCRPGDPKANEIGCVQLSCDEPNGPTCVDGYGCRPEAENAITAGTYLGCSLLRCDEAAATPCLDGYECSPVSAKADAAGCIPSLCNAGWTCSPWQQCDPAQSDADLHGCGVQECTTDANCGCGFCTNGVCVPQQSYCFVPEIVATPYGSVWPDDEWV